VDGLLSVDFGDPRALAKTAALTMVVAGAFLLALGTWFRYRRRVPSA
jgi:hypothetical protein